MRDPDAGQAEDGRRAPFVATLVLLCVTAISVSAGVLPTAVRPPQGLFGALSKEIAIAIAVVAVPSVPLAGLSAWGVWRRAGWGEALGVITLVFAVMGSVAALLVLFR